MGQKLNGRSTDQAETKTLASRNGGGAVSIVTLPDKSVKMLTVSVGSDGSTTETLYTYDASKQAFTTGPKAPTQSDVKINCCSVGN
jgi:hypothetical protein